MILEERRLPVDVTNRDRGLRDTEAVASRDLCELRWRWTLDPSNQGRMSFTGYGKQVGVSAGVIRTYARAHELLLERKDLSVQDARRLASMSADRGAAFQALAKAEGRSIDGMERDSAWRREANSIKAEIELERETQMESGVSAEEFDLNRRSEIAAGVATRRKEVREIWQRPDVPVYEPVGIEYSSLLLHLGSAATAVNESVDLLNVNNRFDEEQKKELRRRMKTLRSRMAALDMAFDAMETDMDELVLSLTEGNQ